VIDRVAIQPCSLPVQGCHAIPCSSSRHARGPASTQLRLHFQCLTTHLENRSLLHHSSSPHHSHMPPKDSPKLARPVLIALLSTTSAPVRWASAGPPPSHCVSPSPPPAVLLAPPLVLLGCTGAIPLSAGSLGGPKRVLGEGRKGMYSWGPWRRWGQYPGAPPPTPPSLFLHCLSLWSP
jgi:hypothetical protein